MTFVIPVISHLGYLFSRWSIPAHTVMPGTAAVLKPLLVSPAPRPDRSLPVFVDPTGGFLVEKLCRFLPTATYIHVLTVCNLYDSFQFTLQLHRTLFDSCGRKYLLSKRLHTVICSSAFSPEFLYSLYWVFWCNFPLLFVIFWQGKGRLLYHALKFNLPEVYELQGSGCQALLCLHQFALQKSKPMSRNQNLIWR